MDENYLNYWKWKNSKAASFTPYIGLPFSFEVWTGFALVSLQDLWNFWSLASCPIIQPGGKGWCLFRNPFWYKQDSSSRVRKKATFCFARENLTRPPGVRFCLSHRCFLFHIECRSLRMRYSLNCNLRSGPFRHSMTLTCCYVTTFSSLFGYQVCNCETCYLIWDWGSIFFHNKNVDILLKEMRKI